MNFPFNQFKCFIHSSVDPFSTFQLIAKQLTVHALDNKWVFIIKSNLVS